MAKQPIRRRIGPLDTLVIEGVVGGPTVILFHGFGADCSDLAPLAQYLQGPPGVTWVFPNGPISVPLGGHYEGRAWFPISISELEKSMMTGQGADFSEVVPPGLKQARHMALGMIEALNVPHEQLVLGGFSQGGMLATDLTLHMEQPPAGLAVLSGTLVNASRWTELAAKKSGFPFFQCHGVRDPVLSFAMAERLEKLFLSAGWKGRLVKFNGAHEIPHEALFEFSKYLRQIFVQKPK